MLTAFCKVSGSKPETENPQPLTISGVTFRCARKLNRYPSHPAPRAMSRLPVPLFVLGLLLLAACAQSEVEEAIDDTVAPASAPVDRAQAIVDQAVAAHGGEVLQHAVVEFDFRDKHFKVTRDGGLYTYERTYTDSTGAVREVLNNDGIYREIDGARVALSDEDQTRLSIPLNSVPYFALLPFNLNDPAVKKRYLGEAEVEGAPYHKVEVTFRQEDGGSDFEDRFIYWFHRDQHTMDYLAYDFHRDEGGTRFRKAFNARTIGGVRIADYHNFVSDSLPTPETAIERYDAFMEAGAIELLSDIILDNVTVQPLRADDEGE